MSIRKIIVGLALLLPLAVMAGNPDRVGEAGAAELLINPWAQSSGWNGLNVANVTGMESMRTNVAGLAFTNKTEVGFSRTMWLEGSDIDINAFAIAQKMGEGALGISVVSLNMGEVAVTTTELPEGTGATFEPRFSHIGLSYSRKFADYLSGGITLRGISQSISDVNAFGFALDVGIIYVTGSEIHPEKVKFGIALKNVGTPMRFGGDGLSFRSDPPDGTYVISVDQQAEDFELPSLLTIGLSYDFYIAEQHRITAAGNFTSNSFYKDQIGLGLEYGLKIKNVERFMLRASYRYEEGITSDVDRTTAHTGIAAGFSFQQPLRQDGPEFAIDYAYRTSNPFNGSHTLGLRFNL